MVFWLSGLRLPLGHAGSPIAEDQPEGVGLLLEGEVCVWDMSDPLS